MRHILSIGAVDVSVELLATAGDRVALERLTWSDGEHREVVDSLCVVEVDAAGLVTAIVTFDPDNRLGAWSELQQRWADGEAAGYPETTRLALALLHAVLASDWEAWRALLADDLSFEDHRAGGIGTITGPEWVEAQRVLTELSPDVTTVPTEVLAIADHGWISRVRITGTLADGGPFESDHVDLFTVARGRITHVEMFDPDAVAEARARFEELRPPS